LGGGRFFGCETCVAICPHVGPKYNCDFYEQTVAVVQIPAFWKQPPWRDAVFAAAPAWRLARNQAWALEHIPW
jgi:epoxyqueuosine reductase QueG